MLVALPRLLRCAPSCSHQHPHRVFHSDPYSISNIYAAERGDCCTDGEQWWWWSSGFTSATIFNTSAVASLAAAMVQAHDVLSGVAERIRLREIQYESFPRVYLSFRGCESSHSTCHCYLKIVDCSRSIGSTVNMSSYTYIYNSQLVSADHVNVRMQLMCIGCIFVVSSHPRTGYKTQHIGSRFASPRSCNVRRVRNRRIEAHHIPSGPRRCAAAGAEAAPG